MGYFSLLYTPIPTLRLLHIPSRLQSAQIANDTIYRSFYLLYPYLLLLHVASSIIGLLHRGKQPLTVILRCPIQAVSSRNCMSCPTHTPVSLIASISQPNADKDAPNHPRGGLSQRRCCWSHGNAAKLEILHVVRHSCTLHLTPNYSAPPWRIHVCRACHCDILLGASARADLHVLLPCVRERGRITRE
jgi:hypothetical protein